MANKHRVIIGDYLNQGDTSDSRTSLSFSRLIAVGQIIGDPADKEGRPNQCKSER
jgi:hypothetical protein